MSDKERTMQRAEGAVVVEVPLDVAEAGWLRTLATLRGISESDMLVLAFREKYPNTRRTCKRCGAPEHQTATTPGGTWVYTCDNGHESYVGK